MGRKSKDKAKKRAERDQKRDDKILLKYELRNKKHVAQQRKRRSKAAANKPLVRKDKFIGICKNMSIISDKRHIKQIVNKQLNCFSLNLPTPEELCRLKNESFKGCCEGDGVYCHK